LMLLTAHCIE